MKSEVNGDNFPEVPKENRSLEIEKWRARERKGKLGENVSSEPLVETVGLFTSHSPLETTGNLS